MKQALRALTQKVALVSTAFILAVSTLTAAVPFILAQRVNAAPIITATTMATVDNYADLVAVLTDPSYNAVSTVNLAGNITATAQLNINRPLTLNGNGWTVKAAFNGGSNNDTVIAASKPVTFVNVIVDGDNRTGVQGVQIYNTTATLTSVTIKNNKKAGLNINGSNVTVTNIVTQNNSGNYGGIHLSQGSGITAVPQVTINGQSLHISEATDIYTDKNAVAVVNDTNGQYTKTFNSMIWGVWTLNAAPAAPVITAPVAASVVTNPATLLTWDAATYASTYDMILDGVTYNGLTGTSYTMSLTEGPHTVQLRSVAASGLAGDWGTVRAFSADLNDVPVVTVATPAVNGIASTVIPTNLNKLKVTGNFTDDTAVNNLQLELVKNGSPVTGATMHYNNPGLNTTTGAFTYNMAVPANLASGTYSLFYTGTDFQNGVTARFERVFTIDNDMPVFALVTPTNNAIINGVERFTVESNEDISKWLFSLNGKAYGPSLQRIGTTNTWYVDIDTATIPDGQYSVTLRATDLAGNTRYWNNSGNVHKFTIDNSTPTTSITSHAVLGNALSFEGEVADAHLNYYYCYLTTNQLVTVDGHTFTPGQEVRLNNDADSSRNSACETTWAGSATTLSGVLGGFNIAGVPDGDYTINLVAMDRAGNSNAAAPTAYSFTLDRTAPAVAITSLTADRIEGTGEVGATIAMTIDGTAVGPITVSALGTWFYDFVPALSVGTHAIVVTAEDAVGNSATQNASLIVPAQQDGAQAQGAAAAQTFPPAAQQEVLGETDDASNNEAVDGASTVKTPAEAVNSDANQGKLFGLAWYWWLLIIAALATIVWWIIGAVRRRQAEN